MTQPDELPAVLAIDGGNSKTEVALVGADGTLRASARGPGSNHQMIGIKQAFGVLGRLVTEAAGRAGLSPGGPVARRGLACLAGVDLEEEERYLAALIRAHGWTEAGQVLNDTFAILRAGLEDDPEQVKAHWGIGVTCGAGINCVGVSPAGKGTRFLSMGVFSGDWGGGEELAREALWHAARAEDGRGPETGLRLAVAERLARPSIRDVSIACMRGEISRNDLHVLAPVLFEVAGHGDEVARSVIIRQADEVATMITVAATRLGLTEAEVPVVLGGSVLTARHPILADRLTERLAETVPHAVLRYPDVPPVAGAALLGLDSAGADPAAATRLRSYYQDRG